MILCPIQPYRNYSEERQSSQHKIYIMLDNRMRNFKDRLLQPLVLVMGGVSPNMLTIAAMMFGLAAAGFAAASMFPAAILFWIINRILDGMDGLVARQNDRQSDFGGYLDIVADFVVYAAIPIGLFLGQPSLTLGVSLALLLGSFYVNGASWMYLAAILEKRAQGAGERAELTTVIMPAGLIGGTETLLFFSAFLIWPAALSWLFLVMAALVMVGVCQRLAWAWRNLEPVRTGMAGEHLVAVVNGQHAKAPADYATAVVTPTTLVERKSL